MKADQPIKIRKRADITPALIDKVKSNAAAGCNFAQTALNIGYDEDSLRRWMVGYFNQGRAHAIAGCGATLVNMARGVQRPDGTWVQRPNLGALVFFLKCQGGWRETTGIVLEEAKPDDENQNRLIELLESRFSRLASMQARKKTDKEPSEPTP